MELNTLRIVVTVLSFVCFLFILFWAYGRKNAAQFQRLGWACLDLPAPENALKKSTAEKTHGALP